MLKNLKSSNILSPNKWCQVYLPFQQKKQKPIQTKLFNLLTLNKEFQFLTCTSRQGIIRCLVQSLLYKIKNNINYHILVHTSSDGVFDINLLIMKINEISPMVDQIHNTTNIRKFICSKNTSSITITCNELSKFLNYEYNDIYSTISCYSDKTKNIIFQQLSKGKKITLINRYANHQHAAKLIVVKDFSEWFSSK